MYRYRELLMSLLASAMLTTALSPSTGVTSHAGVVNPTRASRLLESALAIALTGNMSPTGSYAPVAPATPPTTVAIVARQPTPPITPERMRVVSAAARTNRQITPMSLRVTDSLGFTPGVAVQTQQAIFRPVDGSMNQVFAVDANGSDNVLVFRLESASGWFFRCDMRAALISAVRYENNALTVRDVRDPLVRAAFEAELHLWAEVELPEIPPQA